MTSRAVDEAAPVFDPRTRADIFESAGDSAVGNDIESVMPVQWRRVCSIRIAPENPSRLGAGMSLMEMSQRENNPVDVVERLASMHDWSFDRAGDDEIAISVKGRWTDYHVSFTWMDDIEALHLACAFDLKVPEPRRAEVLALIALVNEQLWVGHFDMWARDGIVMFRHALLLAGGVEIAGRQCEALLDAALDTSERYFQAFQFVVWAGKNARDALDAAMFETAGEA
jgi:hypothetical protein